LDILKAINSVLTDDISVKENDLNNSEKKSNLPIQEFEKTEKNCNLSPQNENLLERNTSIGCVSRENSRVFGVKRAVSFSGDDFIAGNYTCLLYMCVYICIYLFIYSFIHLDVCL
jgi:hypothetical protein